MFFVHRPEGKPQAAKTLAKAARGANFEEFRIQGLGPFGFGVQGLGFCRSGFRDLEFRVLEAFEFRV